MTISENGFRAILNLPLETPFETGFRQGVQTGQTVSPKQVIEAFPVYSSSDVELYLNGRDDGAAFDATRITEQRAAELWPHKNWRTLCLRRDQTIRRSQES